MGRGIDKNRNKRGIGWRDRSVWRRGSSERIWVRGSGWRVM